MKKHEWDIFVDEKISTLSKRKNVLDVGGGSGFQKGFNKYRPLFSGNYKSFDMPGMGADIEGDIHNIPIANESVDGVICNAVLEHVTDPIRAVDEIYRILGPGGAAFFQVPSFYPYHGNRGYDGKPAYGDYWRFFRETLEYMFRDFSHVEIVKQGGYFRALALFPPFNFLNSSVLDWLMIRLDKVLRTDKRNSTRGYLVYAVKK